jgi:Fe-S cluster assembly protein SufD
MQDRGEFAGSVVHVDGRCTAAKLSDDLAKQGVLLGDLAALLPQHRALLEPHFLKAMQVDRDRFSTWHAAAWTGGTVLYVPRNVEIKAPLYSLIGLQSNGAADFSHTLIILEEGASATLLEETASSSADADHPVPMPRVYTSERSNSLWAAARTCDMSNCRIGTAR